MPQDESRQAGRALDALVTGGIKVERHRDGRWYPVPADSDDPSYGLLIILSKLHNTPELALCAAADALGLPEGHRVVPVDVADKAVPLLDEQVRRCEEGLRAVEEVFATARKLPNSIGELSLRRMRDAAKDWSALLAHLRPTTPPVERGGGGMRRELNEPGISATQTRGGLVTANDGQGLEGYVEFTPIEMDVLCAWWTGETVEQVAERRKAWEVQRGTAGTERSS